MKKRNTEQSIISKGGWNRRDFIKVSGKAAIMAGTSSIILSAVANSAECIMKKWNATLRERKESNDGLEVVVLVKQVPDTKTQIKIAPDGKSIVTDNIKWVMNPYDEYAVEEALRLKEKFGGEVTLITVGPESAEDALRTGLAMGADKAIHVNDPAIWGASDSLLTAHILAEVLQDIPFDIILAGKQAIDDDMAQVGPAVAELLGIPQLTFINYLSLEDEKTVRVNRQVEGGAQVIECALPVLITCQSGLNEPRYASLPGIMKAKKKPLENKTLALLGLDPDEVRKAGDKTQIISVELPTPRPPCKIIEGETVKEKASTLFRLLREKARVL